MGDLIALGAAGEGRGQGDGTKRGGEEEGTGRHGGAGRLSQGNNREG